jgi:mRNA interferase RelE/StbE
LVYQIKLTPAVEKTVARLPKNIRQRITAHLLPLAENPRPHGAIKLAGEEAYRIRVGDYRIIYTIEDAQLIVYVIDVGHRGDVYRRR